MFFTCCVHLLLWQIFKLRFFCSGNFGLVCVYEKSSPCFKCNPTSMRFMSASVSPAFCSAPRIASAGPIPMMVGSHPTSCIATRRASGTRLFRLRDDSPASRRLQGQGRNLRVNIGLSNVVRIRNHASQTHLSGTGMEDIQPSRRRQDPILNRTTCMVSQARGRGYKRGEAATSGAYPPHKRSTCLPAPSQIPEAFAAVTTPSFLKTGRRAAIFSADTGRGCSSASTT